MKKVDPSAWRTEADDGRWMISDKSWMESGGICPHIYSRVIYRYPLCLSWLLNGHPVLLISFKLFLPSKVDTEEDVEAAKNVWAAQDELVARLPGAMKSAFVRCDSDVKRRLGKSGTTATLAVICGWELVVAAVGDSLAYLDTGSQVGGWQATKAAGKLGCQA